MTTSAFTIFALVLSRNLETIDARMQRFASEFDHFVNQSPCVCGSRFSLAAKPRCLRCDKVVHDSYFNTVHERLTKGQELRMVERFGPDWRDG